MPAYSAPQVSDQQLADLLAYFQGLPKAAAPKVSAWQGTPQELNSRAVWRVIVPAPLPVLPGASLGQRMAMSGAGCAQCHGPDMDNPRRWAGGAGGDYAWLTSIVYNEGSRSVEAAKDMGTYSRARLPEASLREIWNYMNGELGLRAFMSARAERGTAAGTNATYSVRVRNEGVSGKGLAAEDVQVSLALAPGVKVLAQTGPGTPAGAGTVTWRVPRVGAGEELTYTVTLAGPGAAAGIVEGSIVRWTTPAADARRATAGDSIAVTLPRPLS
jgi:mono/diheme cytochrome c family protein